MVSPLRSTETRQSGRDGMRILTISALTALIKGELEEGFHDIWVEGEVTGAKIHSSGHCYFSLKDAGAQISCTLWKSQVARLRFRLQDGQKVLAKGSVSVYEPRGTYSLNVATVEPRGVGELQLAFEQLKARLGAEGLFDPARKRPLPFLATRIGLVTSPTGAALRDLLHVIHRRNPGTEVVISPARVQGAGAAQEIAQAIERLNRYNNVQVIIVGRGGGSFEDLFCFNEEPVARALAASRIPTVSAVGHEVDVTISDYVADLRAPTPSAAAELVVRERSELEYSLDSLHDRLVRAMFDHLRDHQQRILGLTERIRDPRRKLLDQHARLEGLVERLSGAAQRRMQEHRRRVETVSARLERVSPQLRLASAEREVNQLQARLERAVRRRIQIHQAQFERAVGKLDALSPLAVLGRGYAIAQRQSDGKVIVRAQEMAVGEALRVRVQVGTLACRVEGIVD